MRAKAMKKAWEIFREAGIRTIEAWSFALKRAWEIVKNTSKAVVLKMEARSNSDKMWVAEIVGTHPRFKFERNFLTPDRQHVSRSGNAQWKVFTLVEGKVYQVNEPDYLPYFAVVKNGKLINISEDAVKVRLVVA